MVNFDGKFFKFSKKRGISSIVGGLIFLVLLTSGFSAFYVAIDVQRDTVNAQRDLSGSIIEKTQETFEIAVSTDPNDNNRLGVQVKNMGQNPLEISNIWIVNKSDADKPAKKIYVDYSDAFIPPGYGANVFANNRQIMYTNEYDVKVVSTLGTIKKSSLSVGGNNYLKAELFTIPPDVRQGENVTVALRVTNIADITLTNVAPKDNIPPNVDPIVSPSFPIDTFQFISPILVDLEPGESSIFTWQYRLKSGAPIGSKVTFSHSANATDPSFPNTWLTSNIASDKITIQDPQGGSGELEVIKEDLVSKPGIFLVLPGPFGDDGGNKQKGLWGVNVANPTDTKMNVTKVVFTLIDPEGGGGFKMFKSGCPVENISPWGVLGAGDWKCVLENQLRWKNIENPIQIPPKSTYSFLARVETGDISGAGGRDLDAMPVQATVVTSSGQFGKAGYDSSLSNNDEVLANIFLGNGLGTITNNNINSTRTGILGNSIETFNIWLADFGIDSDEKIKGLSPDSKITTLIINVPREWEVQLPLPPSNDADWVMTYYPFSDGSSQIIGTLKNDISTSGKKITFDAKAPDKTDTRMYVMYVLANGLTDNDFSVSPLNEIVLQVCPSTTGC